MAARKRLAPKKQLQTALVPSEKQPYKLPENWCWVKGLSLFKPMKSTVPTGETFRYIDIESINNRRQEVNEPKEMPVDRAPSRARRKLSAGDTIFSMVRPYLKNIAYIDESLDGCIASTGFYVCSPTEYLDGRYLYYLMCSGYVVDGLNAFMKGDNSPSIRSGDIEQFPFPLPPINEQHRIASRIEWLFAKIDDAENELREIIDGAEQRQAAILHKAFNGELSKAWRTTHNVNQDTWSIKRFDEVAYIRSNLVDPAAFAEYPHIAPDNIEKKTGVLLPYRTIGEDGVKSGKHHFYPGQILYSKIRPYLSKAVVVDFEGLCSADMYPIEAMEDTRYLWYYILSEDFLEQTYSAGSRTVLPKINQKGLSAIKVPIPTEAEQRFIAEALDTYFESSREAELQVIEALQQIQKLRQTILAKALRGKLGTNNPDEPSSKKLFASVLNGNAGK